MYVSVLKSRFFLLDLAGHLTTRRGPDVARGPDVVHHWRRPSYLVYVSGSQAEGHNPHGGQLTIYRGVGWDLQKFLNKVVSVWIENLLSSLPAMQPKVYLILQCQLPLFWVKCLHWYPVLLSSLLVFLPILCFLSRFNWWKSLLLSLLGFFLVPSNE